VLLLTVVAGCNGWISYRGDPGLSGFNPDESILDTANVASLTELFAAQASGALVGAPVVVDDVVYVTSTAKELLAYHANGITNCGNNHTNCQPMWKAALPTDPLSAATVSGGLVYVVTPDRGGTSNGRLMAFKAGRGEGCAAVPGQVTRVCLPVWQAAASSEFGSPTVTGGVVYVAHNGTVPDSPVNTLTPPALLAFDAAGSTNCGGTPRTCAPLWSASANAILGPAVAGGRAYTVDVSTGVISAFDATGTSGCTDAPKVCAPLWTSVAAPGTQPVENVVVVDGTVFRHRNESLAAFDAAGVENCTGSPTVCQPVWTAQAPWSNTLNLLAVAYGNVYVGGGGTLGVFDAAGVVNCGGVPKTCSRLRNVTWDTGRFGEGLQAPGSSLSIANGIGYIAIGQNAEVALIAFDARTTNGCTADPTPVCPLLARITPLNGTIARPSTVGISGGRAYFGTADGVLHVFGLRT
jgi:hypothetical protein